MCVCLFVVDPVYLFVLLPAVVFCTARTLLRPHRKRFVDDDIVRPYRTSGPVTANGYIDLGMLLCQSVHRLL